MDACKIPKIFSLPAVVLIFNFTSKFEDFLFFDASVLIRPLLMLSRGTCGNISLIRGMQGEEKGFLWGNLTTLSMVQGRKRAENVGKMFLQ